MLLQLVDLIPLGPVLLVDVDVVVVGAEGDLCSTDTTDGVQVLQRINCEN